MTAGSFDAPPSSDEGLLSVLRADALAATATLSDLFDLDMSVSLSWVYRGVQACFCSLFRHGFGSCHGESLGFDRGTSVSLRRRKSQQPQFGRRSSAIRSELLPGICRRKLMAMVYGALRLSATACRPSPGFGACHCSSYVQCEVRRAASSLPEQVLSPDQPACHGSALQAPCGLQGIGDPF